MISRICLSVHYWPFLFHGQRWQSWRTDSSRALVARDLATCMLLTVELDMAYRQVSYIENEKLQCQENVVASPSQGRLLEICSCKCMFNWSSALLANIISIWWQYYPCRLLSHITCHFCSSLITVEEKILKDVAAKWLWGRTCRIWLFPLFRDLRMDYCQVISTQRLSCCFDP